MKGAAGPSGLDGEEFLSQRILEKKIQNSEYQ